MKHHRYTDEQIRYIRKIAQGKTIEMIVVLFNEKFGTHITFRSMKGIMYRNQIKTGMQGYKTRFKKGQESWCKGMKGLQLGGDAGFFKKGNIPPTKKPVGSEVFADNSVMIKVSEPNVWRRKHIWLWEQHHGEVADDCYVHFKDGDRKNVTLENLFLVPKRVFTSVMKRDLQNEVPELNVAIHKVTELDFKIRDYEVNASE